MYRINNVQKRASIFLYLSIRSRGALFLSPDGRLTFPSESGGINLPTGVLMCEDPSEFLLHVLAGSFQLVHASTQEYRRRQLSAFKVPPIWEEKVLCSRELMSRTRGMGWEYSLCWGIVFQALARVWFLQVLTNDTPSQTKIVAGN